MHPCDNPISQLHLLALDYQSSATHTHTPTVAHAPSQSPTIFPHSYCTSLSITTVFHTQNVTLSQFKCRSICELVVTVSLWAVGHHRTGERWQEKMDQQPSPNPMEMKECDWFCSSCGWNSALERSTLVRPRLLVFSPCRLSPELGCLPGCKLPVQIQTCFSLAMLWTWLDIWRRKLYSFRDSFILIISSS